MGGNDASCSPNLFSGQDYFPQKGYNNLEICRYTMDLFQTPRPRRHHLLAPYRLPPRRLLPPQRLPPTHLLSLRRLLPSRLLPLQRLLQSRLHLQLPLRHRSRPNQSHRLQLLSHRQSFNLPRQWPPRLHPTQVRSQVPKFPALVVARVVQVSAPL